MRSLSLKKETLAELTNEELGGLVGASYKTKYDCTVSYQVCLSAEPVQCPTSPTVPTV